METLGDTGYKYTLKELTGYAYMAHRKRIADVPDDCYEDLLPVFIEDIVESVVDPDGNVVEDVFMLTNAWFDVIMPLASAAKDSIYPKAPKTGEATEKTEV